MSFKSTKEDKSLAEDPKEKPISAVQPSSSRQGSLRQPSESKASGKGKPIDELSESKRLEKQPTGQPSELKPSSRQSSLRQPSESKASGKGKPIDEISESKRFGEQPTDQHSEIKVPVKEEPTNQLSEFKPLEEEPTDQLSGEEEPTDQPSEKEKPTGQLSDSDEDISIEEGKHIDYVICWEEEAIVDDVESKLNRAVEFWEVFKPKLENLGVIIEEEHNESDEIIITFAKLSIPFDLLCQKAQELNIRVPLKHSYSMNGDVLSTEDETVFKQINKYNFMENDIPYTPKLSMTAVFRIGQTDKYRDYKKKTCFTQTQRHHMAYHILTTLEYGKASRGEVGIGRQIEKGILSAAFPLHEGPYETPDIADSMTTLNRRQVLYEYWAKWSKFYKYQPLDNIREYFGEKIAFYFAWLGFYTTWLFPASIAGLMVSIYGLMSIGASSSSREICDSNMSFPMCPTCDVGVYCKIWYYSSVCVYSRITYLFDNPGIIVFSVFMSLWGVLLIKFWKRQNSILACRWDALKYEEEEEKLRAQYTRMAYIMRRNAETEAKEKHLPTCFRCQRMTAGIIIILLMLSVVAIFVIGVIAYRILIVALISNNPLLRSKSLIFSTTSAALVNLVLIVGFGKVYEQLAHKLNEWEIHRTQSDFENHLIFKIYFFQFFNFYSSIFYIAFFKGKFTGYPGNYTYFLGMRNEECSTESCLFELAVQIGVIMIGNHVINIIGKLFFPKIVTWFHKFSKGLDNLEKKSGEINEISVCLTDYKLIPHNGLFEEYMEQVIQFGFVTMFVAAFPLAPLFAFVNNLLEIRIDAQKLIIGTRRPLAERMGNIGTWFYIFDFIVKLSIISNAFVIAFTSDFVPQQVYKYMYNSDMTGYINFTLAHSPPNSTSTPCRYQGFRDENGNYNLFHWKLLAIRLGFIIVLEHVIFGIAYLIDLIIPDLPEDIKINIKRQNYQAKQIMAGTKKSSSDEKDKNRTATLKS